MKKIFIFVVIIITSSVLLNAAKYVAYWSFEDSTANDFSGNGYHGTMVNSPKPEIGYNGRGTSMRFDGYGVNTNSGDHIE